MDFSGIVISIDNEKGSYFLKPVNRPYVYSHEKLLPDSINLSIEQRNQAHTICIYHEHIHKRIHQDLEKNDIKLNVLYIKPFYYVFVTDTHSFVVHYENVFPDFHVHRNLKYYQSYQLPNDVTTVRCYGFSNERKCQIV